MSYITQPFDKFSFHVSFCRLAPWYRFEKLKPVERPKWTPGVQRKHNSLVGWTDPTGSIWVFPKIVVSQNGWFIMENPSKWVIWGYHYFRKHPYTQVQLENYFHITESRVFWNCKKHIIETKESCLPLGGFNPVEKYYCSQIGSSPYIEVQ